MISTMKNYANIIYIYYIYLDKRSACAKKVFEYFIVINSLTNMSMYLLYFRINDFQRIEKTKLSYIKYFRYLNLFSTYDLCYDYTADLNLNVFLHCNDVIMGGDVHSIGILNPGDTNKVPFVSIIH